MLVPSLSSGKSGAPVAAKLRERSQARSHCGAEPRARHLSSIAPLSLAFDVLCVRCSLTPWQHGRAVLQERAAS